MKRSGKRIELLSSETGVIMYSRKHDGASAFFVDGRNAHFTPLEFACHDGSDDILIDTELIVKLSIMRRRLNTIIVNSGYRTIEHNRRVGGVASSQHLYGRAADIIIRFPKMSVAPLLMAMQADVIGFRGIGVYNDFCHVDTRANINHFNYSTYSIALPLFPPVREGVPGSYARHVILLQQLLRVPVDGVFGQKTLDAVVDWQTEHDLKVDGIAGRQTFTSILKHMRGGVVYG